LSSRAIGLSSRIVEQLGAVPGVAKVEITPSFSKIYGKRIVIMGGGAQVGQVALGAISEADRHNIRGERISVDTIPLGWRGSPGQRGPAP
jgi:energy-converting hydrogenase B subunit Q